MCRSWIRDSGRDRFRPGFVYERRHRHESDSTFLVPPSDLDPVTDPAPIFTTLHRFSHLSRPLDWYDFSFLSLLPLLYPLFSFPLVTNGLWNIHVGKIQCK